MGRNGVIAVAVGLMVVVAVAAQGLFPPPVNVALRAPLNASSTCGDPANEFCFIPGGKGMKTEFEDVNCTFCNTTCPFPDATGPTSPYVMPECRCPEGATLVDVDERKCNLSDDEIVFRINPDAHPLAFANDVPPRSLDDNSIIRTWWQSENYVQNVVFEVDLGRLWQVVEVVVTFFSPRPRAMKLERSVDDDAFTLYQYYAADCDEAFNVTAYEPIDAPDDVNCRTDQSFLAPLTRGKVTFNPLTYRANSTVWADRPGIESRFDPESELKAFTIARRLRMEFLELNTLGDIIDDPPDEEDINKYFYAIENIVVSARCDCNGHAEVCDSTTAYACVCEHNTDGDDCTSCLPLYNNKPWAFGTETRANECVLCECNDHASSCHYDESLDPFPESRVLGGGGVCDNCTDNTCGSQCEECCAFFYPDTSKPLSSPERCLPCDCLAAGTVGSGDCNRNSSSSDPLGQCSCKEHVGGLDCSQCEPGYWNLTASNGDGCEVCTCDTSGTVNGTNVCDPFTGQCPCLPNVIGLHCDACAAETYGLPGIATFPCADCDCDVGGATSNNCDLTTGQCACVSGTVDGRQCNECSSLHFTPFVTGICLVQAENSVLETRVGYNTTSSDRWYTGPGYVIVKSFEVNTFLNLVVPDDGDYFLSISYLLPAGPNFPLIFSAMDANNDFVLFPVGLTIPPAPNAASLPALGSLLLLGLFEGERIRVQIDANSNNPARILWIDTVSLVPRRIVDANALASTFYGDLRPEYFAACDDFGQPLTVNDTLVCEAFVFSLTAEFIPGCSACNCNANGSLSDVCTAYGGQCPCRPNVSQRACNRCSASFWNLGQAISNDGCIPCNCTQAGSLSELCHDVTGQCTCLSNVTGRTCDRCADNYFGYGNPQGCAPCNCDPFGSASQQCNSAGVCACKAGVGGAKCNQCLGGFYSFPTTSSSSGCTPCGCDPAGAVNNTCTAVTGQCTCKSSVQPSPKCTQCRPTTFNLQETNPSGCAPCFCYGLTGQCTSDPDGRAENASSIFQLSIDGWTAIGDVNGPVVLNAFFGGTEAGFIRVTTTGNPGLVQYWVAPSKFRGNQLGAYAQFLSIALRHSKNDSPFSTALGDVILTGNGVTIAYLLPHPPAAGTTWSQYTIQLHPSAGWRRTSLNGPPATTNDIQTALADLQDLLIRGEYNAAVTNNDLALVRLQTARAGTSGPNSTYVEKCACAGNTRGASCQLCLHGYKRATVNGGPFTPCVPCDCNGHADTCDAETGVCINCRNNTAGDHCELCAAGYYGDATQGTESDCQACFCPYQFTSNTSIPAPPPGNGSEHKIIRVSDECALTPGQGFENATCACPAGYDGFNCETCASNYFGNPMLGVPCHNCTCSGNFNASLPNQCSTATGCCGNEDDLSDPGHCLLDSCGCECDVCCDGFYGEAVFAKNCTACGCDSFGSESLTCNKTTGQCSCRENVVGRTCNACAPDTWDLASGDGCQACDCSPIGSTGTHCDLVSGQCSCIPTVGGRQCDVCLDGFYNFTGAGCLPCDCGVAAVGNVCNKESGQCACEPGATGRTCDQCLPNFVNITSGGCADCGSCYGAVETAYDALNNASEALSAETSVLVAALGGKSGTLQQRADALELAYAGLAVATAALDLADQALQDALQELDVRVLNQSAILAQLAVVEGDLSAFIHSPLQQAVTDVAAGAQGAVATAEQAEWVAARAADALSSAQLDLAALLMIVADAQASAANASAQALALNSTSVAILEQAEQALAVASEALDVAAETTATLHAVLADIAAMNARASAVSTQEQDTHTLLVETQAEASRLVNEADGSQTETANDVRDPTLAALGELLAQEEVLEVEILRTAGLAADIAELGTSAALYAAYLDAVANSSAIPEVEATVQRVDELTATAGEAVVTTAAAEDLAAAVLANATLLASQVASVNATVTAQRELNAQNAARLGAAAAAIEAANATADEAIAAATDAQASAAQAAEAAADVVADAGVASATADLYEASANSASAAAAATLAQTEETLAESEELLANATAMEAITTDAQANLESDAAHTRTQAASLAANVTASGLASGTSAAVVTAQVQTAQIATLMTTSVPTLSDDSAEARLLRARLTRDVELLTARAAEQAARINATRTAIVQAQLRLDQLQAAKDQINPLCFAFE